MQAALAPRGDARTYLTHFVGDGLQDDRYVVETFRSLANGEIVPVEADGTKPMGRRKARARILPLKAVEKLQYLLPESTLRVTRQCQPGHGIGRPPRNAANIDAWTKSTPHPTT